MKLKKMSRAGELRKAAQAGSIRDITGIVEVASHVPGTVPESMAKGLQDGSLQALILPIIETTRVRACRPEAMIEIGGHDIWIRETGIHFIVELARIDDEFRSRQLQGEKSDLQDFIDQSEAMSTHSATHSVRRAVMKSRGKE